MAKKIFWIVVIVIGLGVGAFFGIRWMLRSSELSVFNNRIGEYTAATTSDISKDNKPYIKKRILPVNLKDKDVDWFYYELPENLRAKTPEDVGTVVLLDWSDEKIGHYGSESKGAYVWHCDVQVVDHAKRVIVGEAHFRGGEPPSSSKYSAHGSKPTAEMAKYLQGLPQSE